MELTVSRMIRWAVPAFALYFAMAGYLKYTYVPQPDLPPRVYLSGPFKKLGGASYLSPLPKQFADSADSPDDGQRSEFQLFENEKPIGPPHSLHDDIANLGHGRYSHWRLEKDAGVIFSATDNSDPNHNGKRYSYAKHYTYLKQPFGKLGGFSYFAPLPEYLANSADSMEDTRRSTLHLFEDGAPLGPPHSLHADIASSGAGRFSHWRTDNDAIVIFSASDNSDPNESGKRYAFPLGSR
jgi:hypothetical protein